MGKFAWVTLATNDSYSMGALVLAHSLKRVNTVHQLVVLITPGVTEAMKTQLSAVFNVVKLVDVLDSRDADNLALLARPELGITFTKLHCWKLTEYEKCVFLDADTLVLQNSDELFEREELSAAPDAGWPDCFNSGVFVYKPSQETFQALIEFALIHGSFDGGDQGLLNLFFSDWATKDIQKHLPFVYNMCATATYSYIPAFKQFGAGLKIIHFIGAAKPWLQPFNTETGLVRVSGESQHLVQFVQMWWDIFCAHVHPTLSTEMAGLAAALATVTLGAPLTVEQQALEEHMRRQGWEQGNIDYMGKDSFANIWQKICETLGTPAPATQPTPPEDATAPVAPVAAPVYVSSVEISPTGQIDKTPPQANYAPVSALIPTVEASDSKDAIKAPLSETTTVAPEPKPSVTEVVPTETSIVPSAALETSTPTPQVASEPPAALQPATPVESAEKTDKTPLEAPVTPAVPPTLTPATEPQIVTSTLTEAATPPAPTAAESSVPTPSVPIPLEAPASSPPAPTPAEVPVPSLPAPTPTEAPVSTPAAPTPTPTEAPVSTPPAPTPTEVPVSSPPAPTPTEAPVSTPAPTPTEAPVSTPPAPTPTESVVPTPTPTTEVPVSIPSAPTPPEVSTPPAPTPTEAVVPVPPPPTEAPVSTPAPTPTEAPVSTPLAPTPAEAIVPVPPPPTEAPVSYPPTPTPTGAPVSTPPTPITAETPVPLTPTPSETPISPTPVSTVPAQTETPDSVPLPIAPVSSPPPTAPTQAPAPPTPTPVESTPQIPPVSPAPAPVTTPGDVPTPTSESIAAVAKAEPAQPLTPTVTEPTPPTSPPVAADAPQLTKLQVEADAPGTPPAGGSTQPSLEGAVADEPPVPPKRKGGPKTPQDSKNQKGGKPSKGKK